MNHIDVEASRRLATLNPTGCPVGIEPRLWRKTLWERAQTHLDLATALLALVDGLDGDCDLEDNADEEPSLASPEPRYATAPYWNGIWPTERLYDPAEPIGSQTGWASAGGWTDLEDEHDGIEPENEHGPSWTERSALHGMLHAYGDEDIEPSLSLTEHVNQATRIRADYDQRFIIDGEADYATDPARGSSRARNADDEPSLGSPEIGPQQSYWMGTGGTYRFHGSQAFWANGRGTMEEEAVNEDGEEEGI